MSREFASRLEESVAKILEDFGFAYQYAPRIGGLRPDFLVTAPNGATAVLEVKGWANDPGHLTRAKRQAEAYREATGAEAALVVLPEAPGGAEESGVAGLDQLQLWLQYFGAVVDARGKATFPNPVLEQIVETEKTIFAAMPFSEEYDDVFFVAMSHAAKAVGATAVRVDKEDFVGDIVAEIQRLINLSVGVIADLSESRPNVLYEVGYAHALGQPTVPICSTPMDELPFDVGHENTLPYRKGQTHEFRDKLAKRLQAALSENKA